MGDTMKLFTSFFFAFLFSATALARDVQPVFEALKNLPVDYEPAGQICEQVTRLQLAQQYKSDKYDITIGIEYAVNHRTIGELDVVVVDKATHNVVISAEVKCWKSLSGALNKARDQRTRVQRTLQKSGNQIVFTAHEGGHFTADNFRNVKWMSVAQLGSKAAGFDAELAFTLSELMDLRMMLIRCQDQGQCPKP
jgi:hypothetical protein